LEHIAIETDDIEADVERLRRLDVPIFMDKIFDANDGYEAFVYPEDGIGFTVELIQHHERAWVYPDEARGVPVSNKLGIAQADHLTAVVGNVSEAAERFESLFGLPAENGLIPLGEKENANCALKLVRDTSKNPRNLGLERLILETDRLEQDVTHLRKIGVPISETATLNAYPGIGFTVELVPGR
jgi:hypothetical protein